MLDRPQFRALVEQALQRSPITAILGPRQCGKTTLARLVAKDRPHTWFDLEAPEALQRLQNPSLALTPLTGLIVLDEVQRLPDIFPLLRVLADRRPLLARVLLLGSASPQLLRQTSETLAGRIEFVDLGGFDLREVGAAAQDQLWLRGGFPPSFLAASDDESAVWRANFIRTFLERDLPQLGVSTAATTLRRFWTMLAHYHGQTWNAAELAGAMGLSGKTVRHYLDTLTATYVVRQLPPWFENIGKRQVKAPKVYVRDSGVMHNLLGLLTRDDLLGHPKAGASWEGFAIEQILRVFDGDPYFWSTHNGAELDLVLMRRRERWGFELKLADAPSTTRSMRVALQDLRLDRLFVVYPGQESYALDERIEAMPLTKLMASPPG